MTAPELSNQGFPYLLPYQKNLTEEAALDWNLEKFYNLCIFQKPCTSKPENLLNSVTNGKYTNAKPLNQIEIGKEFFGSFVQTFGAQNLVDWFIRLFLRLPVYLHIHETSRLSRNFSRQNMNFQQFFYNNFLLYIKIARQDEKISQAKPNGNKGIRVCDEPTDTRFNFKDEEKLILLRLLIRTDFPVGCKIWSLISSANISVVHKDTDFPKLVQEAVDTGEIKFWSLHYAMSRFKGSFDVSVIAHIVLLNDRVSARMIEEFLADRSDGEKDQARKILLMAEQQWATNFEIYKYAVSSILRNPNANIANFEGFRQNMTDLMIELRREVPRCNLISISWAKTAIKIYMEKFYVKKEIDIEQLYDLVYTILKQRTQLRNDVVMHFRKNKDPISAEYWINFYFDPRFNQFHAASMQPKKNIPPKLIYRLANVDMNEVRDEYLSIPAGVDIYVIDKSTKLAFIEHHLRQCSESDYAIIGLDSEWSPYLMSSRATILQIALHNVIFILDLDSIDQNDVTRFVNRLFADPKIIKLGFGFGEDLLQLRKKLPNCLSLYKPVNLIDLSKLLIQLVILSKKAELTFEEFLDFPPDEVATNEESEMPKPENEDALDDSKSNETAEKMDDSTTSDANLTAKTVEENEGAEPAKEGAKEAPKEEIREVKKLKTTGLSFLCKVMLGKHLDKSEQCSVWTRRPLRKFQIRYAALDAFSILMIYDRCVEWANKLGLKIVDITDAQERISAPLPLFFDSTKLQSPETTSNSSLMH
ncbi:hypothetical protein M3Y97_00552800 [Aphelenchoides bicaudatus]|nr:hypothetical protein M3Y97_00552800 [Aphelenchoides bicaudatus]